MHDLRHVDGRRGRDVGGNEDGLVLLALALDLLLERALQRLDGLGHLVAADLEGADHLEVVVCLQRGAHQLPQVHRVVHRVAVVLPRGHRLQLREDCLRVLVGACERLRAKQETTSRGDVDDARERGGLDREQRWTLTRGVAVDRVEERGGIGLTLALSGEDLLQDTDLDRGLKLKMLTGVCYAESGLRAR